MKQWCATHTLLISSHLIYTHNDNGTSHEDDVRVSPNDIKFQTPGKEKQKKREKKTEQKMMTKKKKKKEKKGDRKEILYNGIIVMLMPEQIPQTFQAFARAQRPQGTLQEPSELRNG